MTKVNSAWWKDPARIAAIFSMIVVVFGFWFVRERQLWSLADKISNYDKEVSEISTQNKENERAIDSARTRIKATEDRTEINAQRIIRMEGIIDHIYPQGAATTQSIEINKP